MAAQGGMADEDDKVTQAIKKTGCLELHYAVQECMFEHKDWITCNDRMQEFKNCINEHQKTKTTVRPVPMLKFKFKGSSDDQKNG